jgi:pimeloyl-ACP methyl ester carboxylesterase
MALAVLVAVVAGCGGDEKAPAAALAGDLKCTGSGSPTVILESGLGVEPTTWGAVIPNVSGAQVCVHQRPGTGSSPPAGHSRTAAAVKVELEQLLDAKHIERPVVIVGASFGGYVAQLYASRRPDDVAAVVLVDSLHPDLKHGISFDPGGDPDPALERAWGRMQRELAGRSPQGELIVARRSHHRIAEDQPALVARAIERVVHQP